MNKLRTEKTRKSNIIVKGNSKDGSSKNLNQNPLEKLKRKKRKRHENSSV